MTTVAESIYQESLKDLVRYNEKRLLEYKIILEGLDLEFRIMSKKDMEEYYKKEIRYHELKLQEQEIILRLYQIKYQLYQSEHKKEKALDVD